jgi:hypothetical protein
MFNCQVLNTTSLESGFLNKRRFRHKKIAGHSCYFFYNIVNEVDMFVFRVKINKNAQ